MPTRHSDARWEGTLQDGKGTMSFGSGAFEGPYTFASRFEDAEGTNPEELLGAAHAGCFSMHLSGGLTKAGYQPNSIETHADVTIEGGVISIHLKTQADVPGIEDDEFQELANVSKENCPVSKALSATEISLDASLVG
jgi:lipoyl-dependent peroxiredoxin